MKTYLMKISYFDKMKCDRRTWRPRNEHWWISLHKSMMHCAYCPSCPKTQKSISIRWISIGRCLQWGLKWRKCCKNRELRRSGGTSRNRRLKRRESTSMRRGSKNKREGYLRQKSETHRISFLKPWTVANSRWCNKMKTQEANMEATITISTHNQIQIT